MPKQPICPSCQTGEHIIIKVVVNGYFTTPVENGTVQLHKEVWLGDVEEVVKCYVCGTVLDMNPITDLYWDGVDEKMEQDGDEDLPF